MRALPLVLAAMMATAATGAQPDIRPPEVAAAPKADAALRLHATDVADYTLRATLDPGAHTVHGTGTIAWRNTSTAAVHELWLHLYLNAFKNDRSAFLRERVGGRGSLAPEDWGWIDLRTLALLDPDGATTDLLPGVELHRPGDEDETDARVPLPRDIQPGEAVRIDVAFDDKLPVIVERTGYRGSFHMVGQWFPKVARLEPDGAWAHFPFHHLAEFYADFGTYDVTLDVPEGFAIGATGPVVETRVAAGRRIERHVEGDIHDFAWTAWDRWQTARETVAGVDVTIFFPRGFAAIAERDLAAVRFALPYFGTRYGPYPYSVLTVVHPQEDAAEAGGMEYPTLITSAGPWATPAGLLLPEIVTTHELGHQWFYGLVATNEAAWPVLDEGINQFAELDAMARWRGESSAGEMFGLRVSDAAIQAVTGNLAVHDEPVAQPASAFSSGSNYGRLVYARTAAVLETLARVYGDDLVSRALDRYARQFRFEHPQPEQLIGVFTEVLGERVAATLRTALFDKGWVDYAIESVGCQRSTTAAGVFDTNGRRETVLGHDDDGWEGSVLVARRGTLAFPVDVDLVFADGSTRRERWDGDASSKRIAWRGPIAIRGAVVDPDDRVVVDQDLENNHASAKGEGAGAPRSLERLTYWAQLALEALSP